MPLRRAIPAILLVLVACGGELEAQPRRSDGVPVLTAPATRMGVMLRGLEGRAIADMRALLEVRLASDPDGMAALNDLALTYMLEQRFDAARHLYEEVLARGSPRDQQAALVNLGELYAVDGYLSAAEAHFTSARALDPGRPEPSYALALLADARADRQGAVQALQEALALDRAGEARDALGHLYLEERQHLDALVAEASGDLTLAVARWRELARGRFPSLARTAQRHLAALAAEESGTP
jgi:tetratricopeptide (TPR) repeat protein